MMPDGYLVFSPICRRANVGGGVRAVVGVQMLYRAERDGLPRISVGAAVQQMSVAVFGV